MLKLKEKAVTSDNNTVDGESGSGLSKQRRSAVPQKPTLKPVVVKQSSNKETQRLCKGAWVCIRTAGVIAKAQRKSELIAGEPTITSLSLGDTAWSNLPSYVLEDLSGLEEASKKVNDESTKKYILKFDASTEVEITWVHLLNYVTHLRRHCSYSSLALGDFDRALVRIPLNCHTRALKLSAMMKFLPAHLSVFNKECCPILPTDIILSLMASLTSRRSSFSELSPLSPFPPKTPEIGEELGEGGKLKMDSWISKSTGKLTFCFHSYSHRLNRRFMSSMNSKISSKVDDPYLHILNPCLLDSFIRSKTFFRNIIE